MFCAIPSDSLEDRAEMGFSLKSEEEVRRLELKLWAIDELPYFFATTYDRRKDIFSPWLQRLERWRCTGAILNGLEGIYDWRSRFRKGYYVPVTIGIRCHEHLAEDDRNGMRLKGTVENVLALTSEFDAHPDIIRTGRGACRTYLEQRILAERAREASADGEYQPQKESR